MRDIWFTSDTHFGHEAIRLHVPARRVFPSTYEMDDALIDGINAVVKPKDVLYHLGDFCWKASRAGHFRQRLGVKELHVCQGNHDANSLRQHVSSLELMLFRKFNSNFRSRLHFHMSHYPILSWRKREHGGFHVYGHSHGSFEDELNKLWPGRRAMDVSVDAVHRLVGEWRPINLEEVLFYCDQGLPNASWKSSWESSSSSYPS